MQSTSIDGPLVHRNERERSIQGYFQKKPDAVLPHKWRVREVARLVHGYKDKILPMKHYIGPNPEAVHRKWEKINPYI